VLLRKQEPSSFAEAERHWFLRAQEHWRQRIVLLRKQEPSSFFDQNKLSKRSSQSGFASSISLSFQSRFHFLIWNSLRLASCK